LFIEGKKPISPSFNDWETKKCIIISFLVCLSSNFVMTHWFSYTRSGPLVTISPLYYKRELLIFYFHLYISSIVKDLLLSIPACDAVAKIVNFPTAL